MKKIWVLFILIVGILLVTGCVSKENAIVGKWQCYGKTVGQEGTIQFFKEGTITIDGKTTGNYRFVDDTNIRLDFGSQSRVVSVSNSGNEIILESMTCHKVDSK